MTISLITPTYNSAKTIRDTLNSVASQTYPNLEYIVIDGASQDGTLDIIKEYSGRLKIKLISEPDKGLYDAMNKGIRLASGDIVGILNSDDFFKDRLSLEKIATGFINNPGTEAGYADLEFVSRNNLHQVIRFWRAGLYQEKKLDNGWVIPHPTFFAKRRVYQQYGAFKTEFKLAGDYELLLRLLKLHRLPLFYIPEVLVQMRSGGSSGRNLAQRRLGWQELKKAWEINHLKIPRFFIMRRVFFKINQYLFKKSRC